MAPFSWKKEPPQNPGRFKDQSGTSNQTYGDRFQDHSLNERITLLEHKKIIFCVVVGIVVVFYVALLAYVFCPSLSASPTHVAERVATIIALSAIPTALLVAVLKSLYKSDAANGEEAQGEGDTMIPSSPLLTLIVEFAKHLKDK